MFRIILPLLIGLALSLVPGHVAADEPKQPKSEVEQLKERVATLEARLKKFETILRLKEVLPPRGKYDPAKYTDVTIKVDANGVMWKEGRIHSMDAMMEVFKDIYRDGKFPFMRIAPHPQVPEMKAADIYVALMEAGAAISFEGWRDD